MYFEHPYNNRTVCWSYTSRTCCSDRRNKKTTIPLQKSLGSRYKYIGHFAANFKKSAAGMWTGPQLNEMDLIRWHSIDVLNSKDSQIGYYMQSSSATKTSELRIGGANLELVDWSWDATFDLYPLAGHWISEQGRRMHGEVSLVVSFSLLPKKKKHFVTSSNVGTYLTLTLQLY